MVLETAVEFARSCATVAGATYGIFELLERLADVPLRKSVADWIDRTRGRAMKYREIFELFFGPNQWTLRCFLSIVVYSFFVSLTMIVAFRVYRLSEIVRHLDDALVIFLSFGLLPCFFSVLKARAILNRIDARKKVVRWLVCDALASIVLFNVAVIAAITTIHLITSTDTSFIYAIENSISTISGPWSLPVRSLFGISESYWIGFFNFMSVAGLMWLLLLSTTSVQWINRLNPSTNLFTAMKFLNFRNQPFRVLGLVAAAFTVALLVLMDGVIALSIWIVGSPIW